MWNSHLSVESSRLSSSNYRTKVTKWYGIDIEIYISTLQQVGHTESSSYNHNESNDSLNLMKTNSMDSNDSVRINKSSLINYLEIQPANKLFGRTNRGKPE